MSEVRYPLNGYPMSRAELRRSMGKGPLYHFLERLAYKDKFFYFNDFFGQAAATLTNDFDVAGSGGAGGANFLVTTDVANGVARGVTGTTDNGSVSMISPLIYSGDNEAGMEIRLKADVVAGLNLEFGFIDAVPGANGSGVNDEDTPTMTAGDAALFSIDTDETYQGLGCYSVGSTANFGPTRTSVSTTVPATDTYLTARIQLVDNTAYFWLDGLLVASHDADTDGNIEGGTALGLWVYARTRDTTTKLISVDYIAAWQNRV